MARVRKVAEPNTVVQAGPSYLDRVSSGLNDKDAVFSTLSRSVQAVDAISTGSWALDAATGIGGIPRGRIVEIYGPESCGKTTLALHIVAESQARGLDAGVVDMEHALDLSYARRLGVNTDTLVISQPMHAEAAFDVLEVLIERGPGAVLVVDSVAALVPKAEIEGEIGSSVIGLHARVMSAALRQLSPRISAQNCTVVFINQTRMKIGGYGSPVTTTGGNALKFYASMRFDMSLGDKGDGFRRPNVRIVKNKLSAPFTEASFPIVYGEGISVERQIIELGSELGVITRSGNWFSYGEQRLGNGQAAAVEYLKSNKELCGDLSLVVRSMVVSR